MSTADNSTPYMRIATTEWVALNRENQRLATTISTLTSEIQVLRDQITEQIAAPRQQRPDLGLPLKSAPPLTNPTSAVAPTVTADDLDPRPLEGRVLPATPSARPNEPTPLEHLEAILDAHNVPKFTISPRTPTDATDALTNLIQQAPPPTEVGPITKAIPSTDGSPPRAVAIARTTMPYADIWASIAVEPQHTVLLTPEAVRTAMIALELGTSRKGALSIIGITKRRYQSYEQQARNGLEPYQTLFDLMDVAEARLELNLTNRWVGHTIDSWQAAKELLSRRRRDEWGDSPTITLTLTEMAKLSLDQLAEIVGPEALAFLQEQADELIDNSYSAPLPAANATANNGVNVDTIEGEVVPNRVLTNTGGI